MLSVKTAIFSVVLMFWTSLAYGQKSCLPQDLALQTFESGGPGTTFHRPLSSQNSQGRFLTKVILDGKVDEQGLKLSFQFDPAWEGVSLPYNLYAILVIADGLPVAWYDYTRECQSPPLSFFPGRLIEVPTVKHLGAYPQKLQIMVWGKL